MWDKWSILADELIERYDATLIFTGLPEDRSYIEGIIDRTKHRTNCHYRDTSVTELAVLLKLSQLCISVNTFSMHLAVSQETPLVALIGGTPSIVVLPENNPKVKHIDDPNLTFSKYDPAMNKITVEQVMEKVGELI